MKYYLDIKLLASEEITFGLLWRKLYQNMHEALVYVKKDIGASEKVAFSFPAYGTEVFPMGDILRVFSTSKDVLKNLTNSNKLSVLVDYLDFGEISETLSNVKHVHFIRHKPKLTYIERVKKQAKRHNVSIEESFEHFKNSRYSTDKIFCLPYVILDSGDTQQTYSIFIEKSEEIEEVRGTFDTFGLSKTATVPWF